MGEQVETTPTYETNALRITPHDDQHWLIEWSYQGRNDLRGSGWVAVLNSYDPAAKIKFDRTFIDRRIRLTPKSDRPLVIQYAKLYSGGSKYGHDKSGGVAGLLVIHPDGTVAKIAEADAVTILQSPVASQFDSLKTEEYTHLEIGRTDIGLCVSLMHEDRRVGGMNNCSVEDAKRVVGIIFG
jgi:hypothetical protein